MLEHTTPLKDADGDWEFKRGDRATLLYAVRQVMRAQLRSRLFFLPNWLLEQVGTLSSAAIFFLMGRYVDAGAAPWMQSYGGDYAAYILLGVGFNRFLAGSLNGFYNAYAYGYWSNAFELYVGLPRGVGAFMLGSPLVDYLFAFVDMGVWLVLAVGVFGVAIAWAHLGSALILLVLGVAAVSGLGLVGASTFTLLNSKGWGNPVSWLVEFLVGLFAGVYFPPQILPGWLAQVATLLPQTYIYDAGRRVLLAGATLSDGAVAHDITRTLLLAVVWLALGAYLFRRSLQKASRDGSLSRWN